MTAAGKQVDNDCDSHARGWAACADAVRVVGCVGLYPYCRVGIIACVLQPSLERATGGQVLRSRFRVASGRPVLLYSVWRV